MKDLDDLLYHTIMLQIEWFDFAKNHTVHFEEAKEVTQAFNVLRLYFEGWKNAPKV